MLAYAGAPTRLATDAYTAAHEQFEHLIAHLRSAEAQQMTHSEQHLQSLRHNGP